MQYCNQGSLHEKIYKNPSIQPDLDLIGSYIKQTVEALVYLHSKDIVHRGIDLSLSNY